MLRYYGLATVLSLTWESAYLGKTVFILKRGPGLNKLNSTSTTKVLITLKLQRCFIGPLFWDHVIDWSCYVKLRHQRWKKNNYTTEINEPISSSKLLQMMQKFSVQWCYMSNMASQIASNSTVVQHLAQADKKQASMFHVTGVCAHLSLMDSPHKGPVMHKSIPMSWSHHVLPTELPNI